MRVLIDTTILVEAERKNFDLDTWLQARGDAASPMMEGQRGSILVLLPEIRAIGFAGRSIRVGKRC